MKKLINRIRSNINNRLSLFRLTALAIALDFVAFFAITAINPFQLLNPLQFLWPPAEDSRSELVLYFPKSFTVEENTVSEEESEEKVQAGIENKTIKVKQKVKQVDDTGDKWRSGDDLRHNALLILNELILGPTDLKAKRILKDNDLIADIWHRDSILAVRLNPVRWRAVNKEERLLAMYCMRKSLKANLQGIERVTFDSSSIDEDARVR